jgi:uncharacterized Fe-S cluster-containing protein
LEDKYPILDEKSVDDFLAIMKRERLKTLSSQLPSKDCGDCGFKSCQEMAEHLLMKKISIDKCPHLTAQLILTVNGEQIQMKDFVQNIIGKGIEGMIQTLKGVPINPQRIVIQILHDKS